MKLRVEKKSVCSMKAPYAISSVTIDGREQVVAATEGYGPAVLIDPRSWTARELVPGPGGCMALIQLPKHFPDSARTPGSESIFAIFGCFPGYKFQDAGVYRLHRSNEKAPFTATELFKLPFAHRISFVERAGVRYLIAANLARNKSTPDDWSLPGTLFAAPIPDKPGGDWEPVTIFENLHKNHCMWGGRLDGRRIMFVGGQEGLYRFDLDADGPGWTLKKIIEHEVSEAVGIDIDGDGTDEIVTIEPFHGNRLVVYRRERAGTADRLTPVANTELAYGHGLWAGNIGRDGSSGVPVLIVGNRSGSGDLELLVFDALGDGFARHTIDRGVGSANIAVTVQDGKTWVVTTNQAAEEVAAYRISLE